MPSNYLILCQPKGNEGGKYGYLSEVSVVPKLRNLINIAYVFKTIFLTFFFYWNLLRSFLFSLMFLPWILSSINITFLASLFISLILSFSQKCLSWLVNLLGETAHAELCLYLFSTFVKQLKGNFYLWGWKIQFWC